MENKAKEKRRTALERVGLTREDVSKLAEKYGRRVVRRMSYRAAARELGVDVGHLWHVLHGDRASKRLTQELRKRGIEVEGWAK